ncbi:MAG: hypothetical protein A2X36_06185 [Elusimicrobia bacterium GWA2_69_24]|nr:MAG: hypothetical protein A2X36_06185 [Elusimicrobia bacterium GWA2_69_24]HBL18210.1 hypothetical protein [Elusimicrobiota bacterium]
MRCVGLLTFSAAFLLVAAAAIPGQAAEGGKPIRQKFFGENPKQPHTTTPDDANFQETCARVGICAPAQEEEPSQGGTPGTPGSGANAGVTPQITPERPPIPGAAPEIPKPAAAGPQAVVPGSAPSPRHRPAPSVFAPAKDPAEVDEGMRDAPASINPNQYSLWSLSRPLLLPAAKIREVSADQAKTMGREDYERNILGMSAAGDAPPVDRRPSDPGALVSGDGPEGGAASEEKGRPVVLEMDIAATPGEARDAVAELTGAAGFQADARFEPLFLGADKTRVAVRGWLPPQRIADAMASARVTRLESVGAVDRVAADPAGTWTELLLGVRIPPETSPNDALRQAAARISLRMDFDLRRAIGYQKIPGTSRMVFIVSGRVRVRDIGRLMGDPDIVKIAPSPSQPDVRKAAGAAPPPRTPLLRFVHFAVNGHPFLFLLSLLLTVSLLGSALRRRGGTRPSKPRSK